MREMRSEIARAWRAYSRRAADYQVRAGFALLYFLVLGPSALLRRAVGTPLLDEPREPRSSYWIARESLRKDLTALDRQY